MLYIYSALLLSSILCITGMALSFIDLKKYNFGLYMTLLAVVIFSIALAFYVVKPKACLGPRWFLKLLRNPMTSSRSVHESVGLGGGENSSGGGGGGGRRRLMFFGFNTTALLGSAMEAGYYSTRDSKSIQQTSKLLDFDNLNRLNLYKAGKHFEYGGGDELEKNSIMDEPPSTTLIPPTPPSLDDEGIGQSEKLENIGSRVRAWTLLADRNGDTKEKGSRVRAWTFTCASTTKENENKKGLNSVECWKQWQEFLLRQNGPALMLRSSFPLTETIPPPQNKRRDTGASSSSESRAKSWSTEEVVNLDEFLHSSNQKETDKHSAASKALSSQSDGDDLNSTNQKPSRKNALSPLDDPRSCRRSHTITIKYVPVKQEWIPKPLSVTLNEGFYRKKSRSTNAMFAMINGKSDGSPWWSLSNLLQRASFTQQRDSVLQQMV